MNTHDRIVNLLGDELAHHFEPQVWSNMLSHISAEIDTILYDSKEEIENFNKGEQMKLISKVFNEIQALRLYLFACMMGILLTLILIVYIA